MGHFDLCFNARFLCRPYQESGRLGGLFVIRISSFASAKPVSLLLVFAVSSLQDSLATSHDLTTLPQLGRDRQRSCKPILAEKGNFDYHIGETFK